MIDHSGTPSIGWLEFKVQAGEVQGCPLHFASEKVTDGNAHGRKAQQQPTTLARLTHALSSPPCPGGSVVHGWSQWDCWNLMVEILGSHVVCLK